MSLRSVVMLTYHLRLDTTGARFPSVLLSENVNVLFFQFVLHILPIVYTLVWLSQQYWMQTLRRAVHSLRGVLPGVRACVCVCLIENDLET
jgi:hypothetical protein